MTSRESQWAQLLGRNGVFGALSESGRDRLAKSGSLQSLERGERLCGVGDPGDAAYLVISGEIEISVPVEDGRELWLTREGAGAVLGEMAVLDGEPRSADMTASRRTQVLRLGRAAVLDSLREEPEAALTLLALLARRLRGANTRVEESVALDLGGRLARLLVQEKAAAVTRTQGDMARLIGASRERVNRKLGEWRALGWISVDDKGVHVLDRASLAALGRLESSSL